MVTLSHFAFNILDKIKKVYEFLLCKVGVGRCYCLESETVTSSKTRVDLPESYDSIYIHKSEETGIYFHS